MEEEQAAQLPRVASEKTRLDSIQLLRGVAAGMVVWWHAVENIVTRESTYKTAKEALLIPREFYALGAAGVDIFFVISGFVMLYSMWGGFARPYSPLCFLKKRLIRIFPTYWIFLLLTQTFLVLHHAYGTGIAPDWPRFFYSLALLPTAPGFEGYTLGQAWTLTYELFFYSLFALGLLLPRTSGLAVVALTLVALVYSTAPLAALGRSIAWPPAYPLSRVLGSDLLLEFVLGMGVALAFKRNFLCPGRLLPLGWLVVCGLAALFCLGIALPGLTGRTTSMGVVCMLTVWLCVSWEKQCPGKVPRLFRALGDSSYTTYLAHGLVILVGFRLLFVKTGLLDIFGPDVCAAGMTVAAVACCYALWHVTERPLLHFLRARQAVRLGDCQNGDSRG